MPVQSMTGFARAEGAGGLAFELRSVNGKGLDLRLRLPQGFEIIEPELRKLASARLSRGNLQIALQQRTGEDATAFVINQAFLREVLAVTASLVADGHATLPSADGILSIRGVVETGEATRPTPEEDAARRAEALRLFGQALDALTADRRREGEALERVLRQRLDEIESLVGRAEADPARSPETIRERLAGQVRELRAADERLDEARLHQEVSLLATRADIREELDRLRAHVEAARALLSEGGPIGRRLDFLSQELNRESNTICSKSNATSLTAIGLDLKVVVDQFREQVQNLE
ncbi:YicC/YloC family endoribonuclease [Mangrovicella endophytica]|uniref:YicC/YloC family endoribonuclease n=1 Tax=Mangrovicella endophytica TaxID=2066697 RepID=UPI000C9DEF5C|nr:YicC/YloC family endoribonuclease [Mangrovicella endophytica]